MLNDFDASPIQEQARHGKGKVNVVTTVTTLLEPQQLPHLGASNE